MARTDLSLPRGESSSSLSSIRRGSRAIIFLPPVRGIVADCAERTTTERGLAGVDGPTVAAATAGGCDALGREKASSPTLVTTLVANERAVVGE